MHKKCSHCGLQFEREPGFFFGSMYVSYILSVGIVLVAWGILYFFFDNPSLWTYILTVAGVSVIAYPINYRLSRILFIVLFAGMKFDPDKAL
jgi:uncharacterized protein (DUF983 family)